MDKVSGKLTVFFEDPFWVGVFERVTKGRLSVSSDLWGGAKGAGGVRLRPQTVSRLRFSPAVAAAVRQAGHNPKRLQREARRQTQETGIGTKSQQALKLQQEQWKVQRKAGAREKREEEKERKFLLKQKKKKEKHRGR